MIIRYIILSFFCLNLHAYWSMNGNLTSPINSSSAPYIIVTNLGGGLAQASYYAATDEPAGGYMCWLYSNTTCLDITFQLNISVVGGTTYYFFPKLLNYSANAFALILGGTTVSNTLPINKSDFNRRYTGPISIIPISDTTTITLRIFKTESANTVTKTLVSGFFFTTDPYLDIAEFGLDQVQPFKLNTTLDTSYKSGNYLLNSSFEMSPNSFGWGGYDTTSFGRDFYIEDMRSSETSVSGNYCLAVSSKMQWNSGPIRFEPNKRYTLSFSGKVHTNYLTFSDPSDASKIRVGFDNVLDAPTNRPSVTNISQTIPLTTNWVKYSIPFTNYGYPTNFGQVNILFGEKFTSAATNTSTYYIDDIQLEQGPAYTIYAPKYPLEVGVLITNLGKLFKDGQPRQLFFIGYNTTEDIITNELSYEIRDIINSNVLSGDLTLNFLSGTSTNTLNFSSMTRYGDFRIVTRVNNVSDEISFSCLPNYINPISKSEDMIGIHPNASLSAVNMMTNYNFFLYQTLSPDSIFRDWTSIESTPGIYNWGIITQKLENIFAVGASPVTVFSSNFEIPTWAKQTNAGIIECDLTAYSNFCYNATILITSLSGTNTLFLEFWNEPNQAIPNMTQRINMEKMCIGAVLTANPLAKILIIGGDNDPARSLIAYNGLNFVEQSNVAFLDNHTYPDSGVNSMGPQPELRVNSWINTFGSTRTNDHWNTESGVETRSFLKGVGYNFNNFGEYYQPLQRSKQQFESSYQLADQQLYLAIRSIFRRMRYISYDARQFETGPNTYQTRHSILEYYDALKPNGYELAYLEMMTRGKVMSGVKYTNPFNTYLEGYIATDGTTNILAILNADYMPRQMTFTLSDFIVLDTEGNQVSKPTANSINVGRRPSYIISTTITTNQLSSMFSTASLTTIVNTIPPNLSIDVSPKGQISSDENLIFRYIAISPYRIPNVVNSVNATNIMYSTKLNGYDSDFGNWTQETFNMFSASILATNVTYSLSVRVIDQDLNSTTNNGPEFYITQAAPITNGVSTNIIMRRLKASGNILIQ